MLFVDLPLMLAGPLLRRVEPNLVSVWVALKEAVSFKVSLWQRERGIISGEKDRLASGSNPEAPTLRIGRRPYVVVVTLNLRDKTLMPDFTYSRANGGGAP